MALKYVTEDEIRDYTSVGSDEYDSGALTLLGELAEAEVEDLIYEDFYSNAGAGSTATDEFHDGEGKNFFYTQKRPIISVTSISYDDDDNGSFTALASSDYELYEDLGLIKLARDGDYSKFSNYDKNVKITYVYGYATVPVLVKKLIFTLVANSINPGTVPEVEVDKLRNKVMHMTFDSVY